VPSALAFRITHRDGAARRAELTTAHGTVQTPAFMPVGTQGVVKALTPRDLKEIGAEIILANTYHLHLRPGDELIARRGGLHAFIGWDRPILTDSGGYQVFSLREVRTLDEEGVRFRSHLDGSAHQLTPESAADIQARLGSDIAMVLDECTPYPVAEDAARASMERTLRWAVRARERFLALTAGRSGGPPLSTPGQAQFGIVQGGVYRSLRQESAGRTVDVGFEGYAIGGLSVGEPLDVMYDIVQATTPCLPGDRPRYLMGTGMPDDLVESVARGVDLFDCVLPTRNARNGELLTRRGRIIIKNAAYAEDEAPPDPECRCYTCRHFSRAYLRHLYMAREMTAATLNTLHNLQFYLDTMERIREAIMFGSFENFRREFRRTFSRRSLIS
jgi:queuine tRNA-ribosyltransferase